MIQDALEAAARSIRNDDSIAVEPVIDRDTLAVPGAPDIGTTILAKIAASVAVVADVTIVSPVGAERPTPNPNVLIETGYALKALGEGRIVLVQNTAFGSPEMLPVDLRQKRVLTYCSPPDADTRAGERRRLQEGLRSSLTATLSAVGVQPTAEDPVQLALSYEKKALLFKQHDYELQITLKNLGAKPITEWHIDVEIPTRLLDPRVTHSLRVAERSDSERTLFRATQNSHGGAIYPEDTRLAMTIPYRVDDEIFWNQQGLFDQRIVAKAYVHGQLGATAKKTVRDLQVF